MKKKAALAFLGFGLLLAYIIYSSLSLAQVSCEVCMTFRGRTECRAAAGANQEEAQRTATNVACSLLAAGMTDTIACENTQPTMLMCMER